MALVVVVAVCRVHKKKRKIKGGRKIFEKIPAQVSHILFYQHHPPTHTHTHTTQILYTSVFLIKSFKVRKLKNAPVMRAL